MNDFERKKSKSRFAAKVKVKTASASGSKSTKSLDLAPQNSKSKKSENADYQSFDEKNEKASRCKLNFKKSSSRDEAVSYFQAIIDGIKKGSIEFKQEDESLMLSPARDLSLEIKASAKGDNEKVTFKISWTKSTFIETKLEIR